ncbi:MAG: phage tail tube protein [Xanthobacteraceae bacterium]
MGAFHGRKITLEWDGNEVAGVREKGVNMNGEPVDITSDEDGGWRTLLAEAGQSQVDISVSGVTKSSELRNAWHAGGVARQKVMTLTYPDGSEITALFNLVSYQETGPYKEATTFEASFQSAEEVAYTEAGAPTNQVLPAVAGIAQVGQTLTALVGKWTGATSFTSQWQADDGESGYENIAGATAATYVPVIGQIGLALRCVVTGINGSGSLAKNSGVTADVIAA